MSYYKHKDGDVLEEIGRVQGTNGDLVVLRRPNFPLASTLVPAGDIIDHFEPCDAPEPEPEPDELPRVFPPRPEGEEVLPPATPSLVPPGQEPAGRDPFS